MSDESQPAVFKQLSTDIREGLRDIYQQISTASTGQGMPPSDADALFLEASDELDEVVKTTETAAMNIMEVVEKHLDLQEESSRLIQALRDGGDTAGHLERLAYINRQLGDDLTSLLTALCFQDITGQRIKHVVRTLNVIKDSVIELYVSSGLMMEAAEKDPEKDAKTLKAEANKAVEDFRQSRQETSDLKGPAKNGISQGAIDDMLAQLGL
ncbi:MAG: protein phosphatase CheZ [Desulfovibrionaceae bacterium]|nr:protein phosphatase CheZ [Desulfovibrionaceae bacterium]